MRANVPTFSESSTGVLHTHAKSFSWASAFLPRSRLLAITELYHFCRYADDVADELSVEEARYRLAELRILVLGRQNGGTTAHAEALVSRLKTAGVQQEWMSELLTGLESDLEPAAGWSEAQLLIYCYRVAGVVGLMMCPLIGVRNAAAYPYAIDLGIGMQLTNMARDVAEDAGRGRVYIPEAWLRDMARTNEDVLQNRLRADEKKIVVCRLLEMAERYYESGFSGLQYIPWRTRLAMSIAGRIYRAIGNELGKQSFDPWRRRARTSLWTKFNLSLRELSAQLRVMIVGPAIHAHERRLHVALAGLPGVHP